MISTEQRLLSRSPMRLLVGSLALFAMLAASRAQAADITVTVLGISSRTDGSTIGLPQIGSLTANPIGATECSTAMISLRFGGIDTSRPTLYFYHGTSCVDPNTRLMTTTESCLATSAPSVNIAMQPMKDVTIPLSDLINCAGMDSAVDTIWVLALANVGDTVTGNGQQAHFSLAHILGQPTPPSGLQPAAGDPSAPISWTGGDSTLRYQVFVDPTGCSGGTPSSAILTDGGAVPTGTDPVSTVNTPSAQVDMSGVAVGEYVAVAVASVDRAGNVSSLSNVVCAQRVHVVTWWGGYCSDGGGAGVCHNNGGCSVSSLPGRRGGAFFALLLLGAWWALRRKR